MKDRVWACILVLVSFAHRGSCKPDLGHIVLTDFANVAITANGAYLVSPFDNVVGQYLQLFGEWELIHQDIIKELIPSGPNALYLDVGANIGAWAVPLGKHSAGGTVVAFEATREVSMFLGANIVMNGLQNVQVVNAVIGDKSGDQPTIELELKHSLFQYPEISFGTFSVGSLREALRKDPESIRTISTPGLVLDEFYTNTLKRCPDFIKMDIENHEFFALKGARRMLAECRPVLLLEMGCYHLNKSIILFLDHLGYSMSWLFAPFVRPDFNFNGVTMDSILLNKLLVITGISAQTGEGGVNMVAIQKNRSSELFRYTRTDFMEPVDVIGGRFYIQEYDISVCLINTGCVKMRQVKEDNNMCGGGSIREEDINFWRTL